MHRLVICLALAATCRAADLHSAVRSGDRALVEQILAKGVSPNEHDSLGGTPLHDAAWSGDIGILTLLLDRKADVNAKHREAGSTPLHYAIITNHRDAVELLISRGADVNAAPASGSTPLHLAANRGYLDIAQLLVAKGAVLDQADSSGATALDEASWKGQLDMVAWLLSRGAKPSPRTLLEAAQKGHGNVVGALLDAGVPIQSRNSDNETALDLALRFRRRDVAQVLLARGFPFSAAQRERAIKSAVLRGEADMVELLLPKDADPAAFLGDAALKGHFPVVELLLAKGAKLNGTTALHDAALGGHAQVVEFLIERGADIHGQDDMGNTPLHVAASYGRKLVVQLLLDRGADRNRKNKAGKTPLDLAVDHQQPETSDLLRMTTKPQLP